MFPTSRRPVPSPAALRILRQLAYISSGTACGAAALVAEERRRQTRLAGKIVENSRKLKQHPRYAHSATASLKPKPSFFGTESYWTGAEEDVNGGLRMVEKDADDRLLETLGTRVRRVESSGGRARLVESSEGRLRPETDALRNDELPSEVEKNYEKFARRRSTTRISTPKMMSRSHLPSRSSHGISPNQKSNETTTLFSPPHSLQFASALLKQVKEAIALDLSCGHHERAYDRLVSFATHHHEMPTDTIQSTLSIEQPSQDSHISELAASNLLVDHALPNSSDVDRLADAFFALYPKDSSSPDILPIILASRLLKAAANAGSFEALTGLTSWLQSRHQLGSDHLTTVCVSAPVVFANSDFSEATAFYDKLLSDPSSKTLDGIDVNTFLVIASFLDSRTDRPIRMKLFDHMRRHLKHQTESHHTDQSIHDSIQILLRSGHRSVATRLFSFRRKHLSLPMTRNLMESSEQLFDSLLLHKDTANALTVLRCMENQEASNFGLNINKLSISCKAVGAHETLLALHLRYAAEHRFPDSVYPAIFWAYAKCATPRQTNSLFSRYGDLSETTTHRDCQPAWAVLLGQRWKQTSNLSRVEKQFNMMCHAVGKGNVDIVLYNAMIRACIEAGQPSEAEKYLRQMQSDEGIQPDLTTFGYFVLSAAKAQDWSSVDKMLNMLGSAAIVDAAPVNRTYLFNPVLHEHVRHHEPAEIWSFVTAATEVHGIVPDQTTNNIVLESFVRGKRLDLVPRWLVYMETCGHSLELSSYTAMCMVRRYYYSNRPSHIMMMWICRNLFNYASDSMSEDLILLLRESIAYDMRGFSGQRREREYFDIARVRLELLDKAQRGHVPSPMAWSSRKTLVKRLRSLEDLDALESRDVQNAHLEFVEATKSEHQLCSADDADSGYTSDSFTGLSAGSAYEPLPEEFSKPDALIADYGSPSLSKDKASTQREEESKLLLSLSLGQPANVVEFYHRSVAVSGLPASSYSLEMAISASLRTQNGDPVEAEELLNTAEEAGFHVASALMPLIIQRITSAKKGSDALQPEELERLVVNFYDSMDEHRIPVRHHVATTAASVLIKNGNAQYGVSLLRNVFDSRWSSSSGRPLDIAAMAVFWQGYAQLGHEPGMKWVVDTVLEKGMRIDGVFIKVLARALIKMHQVGQDDQSAHHDLGDLITKTEEWKQLCQERRYQQTKESNKLGNELIQCIAKATRRASPITIRKQVIGEQELYEEWDSYSMRHDTRASVASIERLYAEWLKGEDGIAATSREKTATYRALLRRGLRGDDGRRLKFRYVDRPNRHA